MPWHVGALICSRSGRPESSIARFLGRATLAMQVSFTGQLYWKYLGCWGNYDHEDDDWAVDMMREVDLREAYSLGLA